MKVVFIHYGSQHEGGFERNQLINYGEFSDIRVMSYYHLKVTRSLLKATFNAPVEDVKEKTFWQNKIIK